MVDPMESRAKWNDVSRVSTTAQLKGHRLRMARAITGLSKQELQDKIGISALMLEIWETGRVELTEKNAIRVSDSLKLAGISCSSEWLLSGNGSPPRIMDMLEKTMCFSDIDIPLQYINTDAKKDNVSLLLNEDIRKELNFFMAIHKKSVFHIISKDFFHQQYKVGDCVAGIESDVQSLVGKLAIGILDDNSTIFGRIACTTNDECKFFIDDEGTCKSIKTRRAAKVIWHRMQAD